jgi:hypothetical protein
MSNEEQKLAEKDLLGRVEIESTIRPVTTTGYHKGWQAEAYDFPRLYELPERFPVMLYNPVSSYTIDRNQRFSERYQGWK